MLFTRIAPICMHISYEFSVGHFRYDQFGQNLNRHYTNPSITEQPAIYAIQQILKLYAGQNLLSYYLDLHAHSSKKGCFIYGNVMDTVEDQAQNQLYCKLLSINSPFFDYAGCLFSKRHMYRVEASDAAKKLSAEGSGRVSTYLQHRIIHSYTLECNYNSGRYDSDVTSLEGKNVMPSQFVSAFDKYTPETFADVGRACMVAWLDLKEHNPLSRVVKTRYRTLERLRASILPEIKFKKDFSSIIDADRKGAPSKMFNLKQLSTPWKRVVQERDGGLPSSSTTAEDVKTKGSTSIVRLSRSNDMYVAENVEHRKRDLRKVISYIPVLKASGGDLRREVFRKHHVAAAPLPVCPSII